MDCVTNHTAGYIFAQTGKQHADIIHLHNLASDEEHDTQRGIPADRRNNSAVDQVTGTQHKGKGSHLTGLTNSDPRLCEIFLNKLGTGHKRRLRH